MRPAHSAEISSLSVAAVRRIDAACDRWEAAMQAGRPCQLEECLATVEEIAQPALLRQLLLLEWEYRQQRGEGYDLAGYLLRFPEHATLIRQTSDEHTLEMQSRLGPCLVADPASPNAAAYVTREWQELGYVLLGPLGRGGMGTVYLACQTAADRLVALKLLPHGPEIDPAGLERFRREAQTLARLQHPNITPVFEVGEYQGRPFYSMEYCSGGSLAERLRHARLTPHEAASLVETLARAVHVAHQAGIVHRDLKPSNVLLQKSFVAARGATADNHGPRNDRESRSNLESGTTFRVVNLRLGEPHHKEIRTRPEREPIDSSGTAHSIADFIPKIADFGLAKNLDATAPTYSGAVLGTPQYMAPEQARGQSKAVGAAADIYALGAILYECLTGRPPFFGETLLDTVLQVISHDAAPPTRFQPKTPRDLETICLKCLRKEPHRRYRDAAELAEDLRRFQKGEPILGRRVGAGERIWKWLKRYPAAAALLGVLALSGAMGLTLAAWALKERNVAVAAGQQADAERRRAEHQTALFSYAQALSVGEQDGPAGALLWLARGLQAAVRAEAPDLAESIRRQLGAWRWEVRPFRKRFVGHNDFIFAVAYSPDGKTVLTGSADRTAQLWDVATCRPLGPPLEHSDTVFAVAFSPDGKTVLTGSADHTARLWDVATGRQVGPPLQHENRVLAVAFSPDGKTVLTGSHDTTARLWDAATGRPLVTFEHPDIVRAVAFSPDGKTILTGGDDKTARLWDIATDEPWKQTFVHQSTVFAVAFSPDATRVLTGSSDQTAQMWETATGKALGPPLQHQDFVMSVSFSPDGQTILTSSDDRTVRLWDAATGKRLGGPLQHQGRVRAAAFSPDGKWVLTGSWDRTARLWEAAMPLDDILIQHQDVVSAVAFSPDGRTVLTGSHDSTARLGDAATGKLLGPALQHQSWIRAAIFSPDGKTVLTASEDTTARLWDAATGQPVGPLLQHRGGVLTAAISPDGAMILTGNADNTGQLWKTATGKPLGPPLEHQDMVLDVAFSPDGKTALTGSSDRSARLWDVATGKLRGSPLEHKNGVSAVAFSPDGTKVLTGSWDTTAQLWDAATGAALGLPLDHQRAVNVVAFSPDGQTVLTGSDDKTLKLWDAATGRLRCPPMQHQGVVCDAAFSPDGKMVLTGSDDNLAQLWDTATGRRLGLPREHQRGVAAVAFSPDGKRALTGGWDKTARLWDIFPPVEGDPERVMLWTQAITGMELDEQGSLRPLDGPVWSKRRQELDRLGRLP